MSILNKLKFLFGMIKFEVMLKGKDGKDYVCDDLEVGKELYVQTDAETITIVPDGDYAFEDGTMIKVEGGVISEVTKEETPAEPETEAEMSTETPETPETPETQEPEITFNAELEIKSLKEEVERLKTALLTAVEEKEKMAKQVTELSKEPAVTSITLTTDSVEEVSHSSAVSKLMNYKKNKR